MSPPHQYSIDWRETTSDSNLMSATAQSKASSTAVAVYRVDGGRIRVQEVSIRCRTTSARPPMALRHTLMYLTVGVDIAASTQEIED